MTSNKNIRVIVREGCAWDRPKTAYTVAERERNVVGWKNTVLEKEEESTKVT